MRLTLCHMNLARFRNTVPTTGIDWLSPKEATHHRTLRDRGHREQWLAGRWLTKYLATPLLKKQDRWSELHIESRDSRNHPTAPCVYYQGQLQPCQVSISHSSKAALVALSWEDNARIGVDLTKPHPLSARFASLWLGEQERIWCMVNSDRNAVSVVWAIKEAVYKALGRGQSFRPRVWDSLKILADHGVKLPSWETIRQQSPLQSIGTGASIRTALIDEEFAVMVRFFKL